jgi:hypothetical protein
MHFFPSKRINRSLMVITAKADQGLMHRKDSSLIERALGVPASWVPYPSILAAFHPVLTPFILLMHQAFVSLQPNPLYWAETLSQLPGIMVLIDTPVLAFIGLPPPG